MHVACFILFYFIFTQIIRCGGKEISEETSKTGREVCLMIKTGSWDDVMGSGTLHN